MKTKAQRKAELEVLDVVKLQEIAAKAKGKGPGEFSLSESGSLPSDYIKEILDIEYPEQNPPL